jgi:hypothetical protein
MPILEYQVSSGQDDGYWQTGGYTNSSSTFQFGWWTGSNYIYGFCRWPSVIIPPRSIIANAYISLYYSNSKNSGTYKLHFDDAANPSPIASETDGNSRIKTSAFVSVTPPASGTWWSTTDISNIIQELVNSYSYESGAAMQAIFSGVISNENFSRHRSYDYSGHVYGPKLVIEYTMQTGCPRQAMHMRRLM